MKKLFTILAILLFPLSTLAYTGIWGGTSTTTPIFYPLSVFGNMPAVWADHFVATSTTGTSTFAGNATFAGNVGIGTTNPSYKLDVNGDINIVAGSSYLYNATSILSASTTKSNYFLGPAGNLTMTGSSNTAIGNLSLHSNTTGQFNMSLGAEALYMNQTGSDNIAIGGPALRSNVSGNQNVAIGTNALYASTGSGNVAIGFRAGRFETGSNSFYIDNQDRGSSAGEKSSSLLYGTFNATPANQTLTINASTTVAQNLSVLGTGNSYFVGNVGIGTTNPSAKLHALATTEQLRIGYDTSNYYSTTVGSTGGVTFDAVGSGAGFTFSDPVSVTGDINATGVSAPHELKLNDNRAAVSGYWGVAMANTIPIRWSSDSNFYGIPDTYISRTAKSTITLSANGSSIAPTAANLTVAGTTTTTGLNTPLYTPASSSATCTTGDWAHDASYLYTCTATNTWKRVALSTF